MNIAVVDDLAVGRETLVNYLNEYFSERNMNVTISDFSDAESFVTQFENNKYNMIFFDIYMPGMSGIEAASTVRKTDSSVEIIFLSTSNNFACESYSVNAFCYLVKPITKDAVESLMQRYFEKYEEPSKSLSVLYKTKPEIKLKMRIFCKFIFCSPAYPVVVSARIKICAFVRKHAGSLDFYAAIDEYVFASAQQFRLGKQTVNTENIVGNAPVSVTVNGLVASDVCVGPAQHDYIAYPELRA